MIKMRRDEIAEQGKMGNSASISPCLLDFMIGLSEQNPAFTEDDIVDEACTFMLAGQDSVGAAVAFCLFLLAQNADCQTRCKQEIDSIFAIGDPMRSTSMADLRSMRYLEQCILETLRLYPSVPLIARRLGEDVKIGRHNLSAGTNVLILPYATHRIPHLYPDPERFDPDRFTSEKIEARSSYAFIPFSAGPRNCIGYKFAMIEMKTIVSTILRQYELVPVLGRTKIDAVFRITVRASGGLWIRFKERTLNNNVVRNTCLG